MFGHARKGVCDGLNIVSDHVGDPSEACNPVAGAARYAIVPHNTKQCWMVLPKCHNLILIVYQIQISHDEDYNIELFFG